jgi:hypothetical protein
MNVGPIVISAIYFLSGKRLISVSDCNGSDEAVRNIRNRDQATAATWGKKVEDWQTAVYPSLTEARSGLMRDFGIEWFNLARHEIDNPPVALGMGAPARQAPVERAKTRAEIQSEEDERAGYDAFPGGRFADAMRGTKSYPNHVRCPFRQPARVAAWEAGYNRAHDGLIESFADSEYEDAA